MVATCWDSPAQIQSHAGRPPGRCDHASVIIILVRILFVVMAALIGATSGKFFYAPLLGSGLPPWFGAAIGFGIAVTLIAAEQAFRRRFTRSLVAFLIGLSGGLTLSFLLLTVLRQVLQDEELYRNLDLPVALVATYLVIVTVLRGADRLRVIVPFVEFRAERIDGGGALILDPAVLGDARLPALLQAGLSASRVLLHRSVLEHWQRATADGDALQRARAKRAVDGVQALRGPGLPPLEVDDTEIPLTRDLGETVIRLARLENGRILAVDRDLVRRALAEGVQVVDLSAIAAAMAPDLGPGAIVEVLIAKPGEGKGQGVGHLDDGSLVVVSDAAEKIGQRLRVVVRRLHHTANGRMIFADIEG